MGLMANGEYRESFIQQYFPKMMAKAVGWVAASSASSAADPLPGGDAGELPPPYSL